MFGNRPEESIRDGNGPTNIERIVHEIVQTWRMLENHSAEDGFAVLGLDGCRYTTAALAYLVSQGFDHVRVKMLRRDDRHFDCWQVAMAADLRAATFPRIWCRGHLIGGYDDLLASADAGPDGDPNGGGTHGGLVRETIREAARQEAAGRGHRGPRADDGSDSWHRSRPSDGFQGGNGGRGGGSYGWPGGNGARGAGLDGRNERRENSGF